MAESRRVLVTGVAGYWGARVAQRLCDEPHLHVIGVDATAPRQPITGLDFIQADVRNPLLAELLAEERVDIVCHLALTDKASRSEATFDLNVMGAMKVFGAAATAGVQKIVFQSSTMVYGAGPENDAFLQETHPLFAGAVSGLIRHLIEIESFCSGFRQQNPDVALTVLRFPGIIGPTADTPLTRLLRLPAVPFLLGFDPQLQLIHEDDVVAALAWAVEHDAPGVYNVAAEDPLPLSRVIGLAGKVGFPVFHPVAYWGNPLLRSAGLPVSRAWPIEPDYLRFPWVADLARMRAVLGFTPQYTAAEALREFASHVRLKRYGRPAVPSVQDEGLLRDVLERRRRERARAVDSDGAGVAGASSAGAGYDLGQTPGPDLADGDGEEAVQ